MAAINVADAKRQFSELLDRVSAGERIVISRRGKPTAALVPLDSELPPEGRPAPTGFLALVGAIPEWDEIEPYVMDAFNNRHLEKSRPVPDLD